MHRKTFFLILTLAAALPALSAQPADFSGASALEFTRKIVAFGPRPPGSAAMRKQQAFLLAQLKLRRCEVSEDAFTAATPAGRLPMRNIVARFPGTSGRAVVITGHYDTKIMPGISFVGANDGGASAGFLLEMARALSGRKLKNDVYLVWLDGEEAVAQWSATDGTYGSRHLARKWAAEGLLARIKALINVDMIGDKDLGILQEMNSSPGLRRLVWQTAAELGFGRFFLDQQGAIEDDHVPFLQRGVNALDLIDFDYGPNHSYWHTGKDTIGKLSAESFFVVGRVLLEVLGKLE